MTGDAVDTEPYRAMTWADFRGDVRISHTLPVRSLTGIQSAVMESVLADYRQRLIEQVTRPFVFGRSMNRYRPPVKPAKIGQQIQLDI